MQASTSNARAKIRENQCPSVGEKGVRDASNSVITSKFALIIIVNTIALNLDMFCKSLRSCGLRNVCTRRSRQQHKQRACVGLRFLRILRATKNTL